MVSNHGKSKKSKIFCHCGSKIIGHCESKIIGHESKIIGHCGYRNFMHVIRTMKSKKDFSETFFKSNNEMVVA